jgi:hypothetical protein
MGRETGRGTAMLGRRAGRNTGPCKGDQMLTVLAKSDRRPPLASQEAMCARAPDPPVVTSERSNLSLAAESYRT